MKILICDAFDASLPEKLAKYGDLLESIEQLAEADIALVRSKTKCTPEWIDKATNLKLIIRGGVGIDNIDVTHATNKGIKVTNTPEASSVPVAELTFGLLLSLTSQIVKGHNGMKEGKWLKKECKRTELFKKRLGIIGMGRIATQMAIRAKAFSMKVSTWDPFGKNMSSEQHQNALSELWKESDFISVNAPLLEITTGIINKENIAKMKRGVVIVNTSRGQCVIEKDVVVALEEGQIGGFGTDVWCSDPPENSPLIGAPNTILTPHIGGSSQENLARIGEMIIDKINHFSKNPQS